MQYNTNDIDDLIGKYLAGEASQEEIDFVEAWRSQSDANQQYIEQLQTIFVRASSVKEWQQFDTDAAWSKMKSKLHPKDGRVIPMQRDSSFSFLKIAASILVVVGIGWFAYRALYPGISKPVEVIADRQTTSDTLPDGSDVYLNKQTKLTYSYDKKKKSHVVKLKGEAYFNINHQDEKKFLVDAEGVFIRDIGTSFNVTAYPESNTVEVVVVEGEVQFFTDNNAGIQLKAGGKGVYNKISKTFSIEQPENNVLSYKTKFFSFSNTDLVSVAEALNSVYDKKIVISNSLQHCHLTVSFNDEDIHEIAQVIAETLNLTIRETATEIVLEGQGCENQ
ncbi:MAG TPA: FecR domain-containing protein [Ohtaekwangia sp.]|uniref:FecR family protein n=1 Tax=Ohtaekwangia sp. TaxID=2066019 RepID=UPI002F952033